MTDAQSKVHINAAANLENMLIPLRKLFDDKKGDFIKLVCSM